jgi:hypothetical protein
MTRSGSPDGRWLIQDALGACPPPTTRQGGGQPPRTRTSMTKPVMSPLRSAPAQPVPTADATSTAITAIGTQRRKASARSRPFWKTSLGLPVLSTGSTCLRSRGRWPTPMPLVVLLHGCTQNAHGSLPPVRPCRRWSMSAAAWCCTQQTAKGNAQLCWNWFEPGH